METAYWHGAGKHCQHRRGAGRRKGHRKRGYLESARWTQKNADVEQQ